MNNTDNFNLMLKESNTLLTKNEATLIAEMNIKGSELLEKNNFLKDLSEIMSDDKFIHFFNKYFKTMDDVKTTVIYMKLFNLFKEKYNNMSNAELSNCVNIYLLHKTMTNDMLRKTMINATIKHLENNKNDILDIVKNDINNS